MSNPPTIAKAATWTQLSNYAGAYIADIQNETFPKWGHDIVVGQPVETVSLTVAWIGTADAHGNLAAQVEVAFDCEGKMGALQQVVSNDSSQSEVHSFDNTQNFEASGVPMTDIPPTSMYRDASDIACHKH